MTPTQARLSDIHKKSLDNLHSIMTVLFFEGKISKMTFDLIKSQLSVIPYDCWQLLLDIGPDVEIEIESKDGERAIYCLAKIAK